MKPPEREKYDPAKGRTCKTYSKFKAGKRYFK
jgi:hypothetical protein